MYEQFEVRWEGVMPGDPQQVWDGFTRHAAGWIWEISFEPRVGGAERGLTSAGGTVTVWDPPHHFQTRAERPDGWRNELDYRLEPHAGGTLLRYLHTATASEPAEIDQCRQHTALYLHSLGEYVRRFAGREATYVPLEVGASTTEVLGRLGVPDDANVGDRVHLAPGVDGTVDFHAGGFVGVVTDDALIRVYGRDAWDQPVGVGLHLFAPDADAAEAQRTWGAVLGATEAVA